jgi:hypothetical protein
MILFFAISLLISPIPHSLGQMLPDSTGAAGWRNLDSQKLKFKNGTLSRKRRFLFPATSTWKFDIAFTLLVPLVTVL